MADDPKRSPAPGPTAPPQPETPVQKSEPAAKHVPVRNLELKAIMLLAFTVALFEGRLLDAKRTAQSNSSSNLVDFLITKSNYARLRELTISYDVPNNAVQKLGANRATVSVSGRNLGLWTSYQGFEPEAMFLGGSRGGNAAWEQTTLPQLRSWLVTVNLAF